VDGIERELEGKVPVIRLSVLSGVGRQAAAQYGVRSVPTFVVLGPDGVEASRHVGIPSKDRLVEEALSLLR
jgi:hypothetical protein